MNPRSRVALLIVAGAHLGLVAANACGIHLPGHGWARRVVMEYGALSGADSVWSFFTSDAGTHLRPTFEVTNAPGDVLSDVLEEPVNVEVDLRIANLFSLLWDEDHDFQRTLLVSWAGVMFARHPGAERVVVRVEISEMPTMKEYRAGRRHGWRVVHRATFAPQTALHPAADGAGR